MSGLDDTVPASGDEPVLAHGALPTKIGKYEIEGKLGEGGNGVVLLARDPLLGRKVAIKILRNPDENGEASQRLLREARAAAKLTHDNVIVIHEVGTFEERVYVAMEHISGSSLAQWQKQHEWREVLGIYVRAGRGLAAAHTAGLVHRDFKPDNVLVANDGRVRVTDFGIVAVTGVESSVTRKRSTKAGATPSPELTRTGTIMGTPRYMAPEQHLAGAVDARADQFAFCVSLYEGLFRTLPFEGATYAELAAHVVDGEVAQPPANSPVPAQIRDAIMRGLSRSPDERFTSLDELLAALVVEPGARVRHPARWRWAFVGAAALVVVGVVGWFAFARRSAPTEHPMDARSKYDESAKAFKKADVEYMSGNYQAAVDDFKRAFAAFPDLHGAHAMLFNMGAAYERLGECDQAAVAFRKSLAFAAPTELTPDKRRQLEKHIAEMDACAAKQAGSATIDAR